MTIPESVKIGGITYRIVYASKVDDRDKYNGVIEYRSCEIRLRENVSEQRMKKVLLHEILHGIDDVANIGLTEQQTDAVASGLYQVTVDNPGIFK